MFAPNNAAFTSFIENSDFADAAALLAAGPDVLGPILTYHVVSGTTNATAASEAVAGGPVDLTTVNGAVAVLGTSDTAPTGLSYAGTDVLAGDVDLAEGSVGVVHMIASVRLPPAE